MKEYINNLYKKDKKSFIKELEKKLKTNEKCFVVTVNPETIMKSEKDNQIKEILNDKSVTLVPDGIAIVKASKWLKIPVEERITGVEISEELLKIANTNKNSIYLFGASKEVIEKLVDKIKKDYPNINILGATDGYVSDKDKVMEKIINLKPDITLVALGIPMQEKIIYKYLSRASKGIFIGVGGTFDVLSGSKKRAPKIFIKLNLEWLYRIMKEPVRLKRFWQSNVKFMVKIRKEMTKNKS